MADTDPSPKANPEVEETTPDTELNDLLEGKPIPPEFEGLELPGYSFMRLLGRGGMGVVFLCRQERLNRLVAVKMLTGDTAEDPEYVKRLQREAVTLGNLSHPNIVGCHDIITHDGHAFFVMEFVPGQSNVRDLIRRYDRIPELIALKIVLQAARGLAHANEKGVIHRDVKPENLQVFYDQQVQANSLEELFAQVGTRIMLLDFGLAKGGVTPANETDIELTGQGFVVGSPSYMAPEQALGDPINFRADIYALGTSLYHMLTGETPFLAATPMASLNMKLREDLPDPNSRGAEVSPEVVEVMHKMTNRDVDERYGSYRELIDDLDGLIMGFEGASTNTRLMRRPRKRRRYLLVVATLVLLGILAGVGYLTMRPPSPLTSQRDAWTVSGDRWSFAAPDDESIGEIALVGRGPRAIATLTEPIRPFTRISMQMRLPGDGAARVTLGNQQRDVWAMEMVRRTGADSFFCEANGQPMQLNRPPKREEWQWRTVEIAVFPDHIMLYIDRVLASSALIDEPLREYRLLTSVTEPGLAQFHEMYLTPIEQKPKQ